MNVINCFIQGFNNVINSVVEFCMLYSDWSEGVGWCSIAGPFDSSGRYKAEHCVYHHNQPINQSYHI